MGPAGGRLADRRGPRRVLGGFLLAHSAAYALLLATLSASNDAALLVAAAALLGGTTPPAGSVIRAAWPRLVPPDALHSAYAVDSATNELMFVAGPALVAALLLVMPALLVVVLAGAALLGGVLLLVTSRVAGQSDERVDAAPTRRLGLLGPLTDRPTLVVLCIAAFATFAFGCIRVATLASATRFGVPAAAGILMALLSAGTLAGGLAYGVRRRSLNGRRTLILLCLADAAVLAADALAPTLIMLAILVTATGLVTGPRETLQPALLAEQTPSHHRTEVFAWLNTFMWAGYGAGTATAGHLTAPDDTGGKAFAVAAIASLVAAVLVIIAYRPRPHGSPAGATVKGDEAVERRESSIQTLAAPAEGHAQCGEEATTGVVVGDAGGTWRYCNRFQEGHRRSE
jgi:MFS family permease